MNISFLYEFYMDEGFTDDTYMHMCKPLVASALSAL